MKRIYERVKLSVINANNKTVHKKTLVQRKFYEDCHCLKRFQTLLSTVGLSNIENDKNFRKVITLGIVSAKETLTLRFVCHTCNHYYPGRGYWDGRDAHGGGGRGPELPLLETSAP